MIENLDKLEEFEEIFPQAAMLHESGPKSFDLITQRPRHAKKKTDNSYDSDEGSVENLHYENNRIKRFDEESESDEILVPPKPKKTKKSQKAAKNKAQKPSRGEITINESKKPSLIGMPEKEPGSENSKAKGLPLISEKSPDLNNLITNEIAEPPMIGMPEKDMDLEGSNAENG